MDDPQHDHSCEENHTFRRYAKAFLFLVPLCILATVLLRTVEQSQSPTRVEQMEADIERLRLNNRATKLDLQAIASNYFLLGDDIVAAEQELRMSGYIVNQLDQNKQTIAIAEKKTCPFLTPLTGFCDIIRIGLTANTGRIKKVEAYYFLQSL